MDTCRREGILISFRRVGRPVTTSPLLCRALVVAALQGLHSGEKKLVEEDEEERRVRKSVET